MSAGIQEVQKNHDPAVGFTSRRDFRRYTPELRWNPRPVGNRYIRRFSFGGQPSVFTDTRGKIETVEADLQAFRVELHSGDNMQLTISYEYNDVALAEGDFRTRLYRAVVDTQFSPFMYLVNNVQFDSVSRVLGWQSRFRWILTPGNDIFFVYTHNWIDELDASSRYRTLDRRAAAKAVYTKRF